MLDGQAPVARAPLGGGGRLARAGMRLCGLALLTLALLAASAPGRAAPGERIEVTHRGITILGLEPGPAADYDVPVVAAGPAVETIRAALDLLLESSPYSAAALETLKAEGRVVIAYLPGFPEKDAATWGATLAAFVPELLREDPDAAGGKDFPVVVGRYIVKWRTQDLAVVLAHELLGHGRQHLLGRLEAMSLRDRECEAGLYEEMARQHLGLDKHTELAVGFRRALEWRWCVPFKEYLTKHAPETMALWNALDPDVPRLQAAFEDYLRASGVR